QDKHDYRASVEESGVSSKLSPSTHRAACAHRGSARCTLQWHLGCALCPSLRPNGEVFIAEMVFPSVYRNRSKKL
ncbi:unnamed protein product, partial [Scytosiphon promiscuus]